MYDRKVEFWSHLLEVCDCLSKVKNCSYTVGIVKCPRRMYRFYKFQHLRVNLSKTFVTPYGGVASTPTLERQRFKLLDLSDTSVFATPTKSILERVFMT